MLRFFMLMSPKAVGKQLFCDRHRSGTKIRALTRERVIAGLAAAKRRGRLGGRPPAIIGEKLDTILAALNGGMSKAAVCRNFGVKRTTLIETLARVGWPGTRETLRR
jgi:DNA invertase Pin-like site-specific DNA recombinase